MIAHNLLIKKVNIPYYTIDDIDNMSQVEINQLAKLLKMKGNNRENIKNILRYLHKLDDEITLLPELNEFILNTLNELEIKDINISNLNYNDVINLLKTHRNKKEIRKIIYDNTEKIIIYNSLYLDFNSQDYYDAGSLLAIVTLYNKNIISKIIMDNKEQLKKFYSDKEINNIIKEVKENIDDQEGEVYIGKNAMYNLVNFTFDLIKLNEIGIAKKVFNISNKLHYFGRSYSYNVELVDFSIFTESKVLETIINFIGEYEFIKNYLSIFLDGFLSDGNDVKFLENLAKLEKYDLLVKIIQIYIDQDYKYKGKMLYKILQNIKKAIQTKNDDLILKYIKFI